jgi:Ring finger domain
MDESNFENLVTFISPDDQGMYVGQSMCLLCAAQFTSETDVRILPCNHPFHKKCILEYIIRGTNKICPMCNQKYS